MARIPEQSLQLTCRWLSATCLFPAPRGDRGQRRLGLRAFRFQQFPLTQKALNAVGVPDEALENFGNYHSGQREGFAFLNHAA